MRLHTTLVLPILISLACGGGTATQTATPTTGNAQPDHGHQTPAQHTRAHFKSRDGMFGVTFDRSGAKPKLQIDGSKDIIELTMEPERAKWEHDLVGYFFVSPDGKRMMFVDEGGGVTFLRGTDQFSLTWDKDAPPLGAATIAGTYVPPVPAYKVTIDRLTPIAVTTKFPQFHSADAANLDKVGEALALATKDMFVHYATHGDHDASPYRRIVPQLSEGIAFGGVGWRADGTWDPKAKGLAKYGGRNEGFSHVDTPQGNHMQVVVFEGYKPALADNTPGLVWETSDTGAVFVTLDGARWEINLGRSDKGETLDAGAGPVASWPPPGQDMLLTVPDVSSLVKAGAMPQKSIDDLVALDHDWTVCAAKLWEPAQKQIDQGKRFTEADNQDFTKKARTTCAGTIKKQEGLILQLVEARAKQRDALYQKAKARVSSL